MTKDASEFDPYQPPTVVNPPSPEIQAKAYLQDARVIGNAALVAISIQVLVKFLMLAAGQGDMLVMLTIIHVLAFLGSAVCYLIWVYRVCSNALRINPQGDTSPGWAVGSHFIPLVNWVVPIVTLRRVIRISFQRKNPGSLPVLVVVWWISFWCSNVLIRLGTNPAGFGLWCLSLIVSWGGVIILVTRISRCQSEFQPDPSERSRMIPLSTSPIPDFPAIQSRQSKPPGQPAASDIEAGWGGGGV
ncbi:DUF4328 domain-containing protein [Luteolibacter yonseiensis]|uniref:DUF4328 domain-containing protein n=1 Tax=Luteolibacter yonseiensis TaxID=1144680 RepID=A0A934R6Z2_9BACT|nr:DUF4328 domain-containing protein [Luteolibacter yonseiensis]MBK1816570.1 DUF4328 domain-containing protein [Luteolibacter yonseiensis]